MFVLICMVSVMDNVRRCRVVRSLECGGRLSLLCGVAVSASFTVRRAARETIRIVRERNGQFGSPVVAQPAAQYHFSTDG